MNKPTIKRDPGLQAERTQQAWSRTLLVTVMIGLLSLRAGGFNRLKFLCLAGLLLLLAAVLVACYRFFGSSPHVGLKGTSRNVLFLLAAAIAGAGVLVLLQIAQHGLLL